MRHTLSLVLSVAASMSFAGSTTWHSAATGSSINVTTSAATADVVKGTDGKPMTIVYLENLGFAKIGRNSNADDVAWLRSQGYQVIELDYGGSAYAVSPRLNKDIISINNALKEGWFCGYSCSQYRSYILMEGYRLCRDVSYYKDDPTVYNYPDKYKDGQGDSLYLDLVYPANPEHEVPVVVTFSYSNSFATLNNGKLNDTNKHKRMFLPYFWGAFADSFVEGASAVGFAWAVCDHPKYCDWGQGRYSGGANKSLGAIEVNPDAARKVKSAIRTVRGVGRSRGLSGEVVVTGFSRGSTAAALAVGDVLTDSYEDASRGRFAEESSSVECAVLGSGMFDFKSTLISSAEYSRMNTYVNAVATATWEQQGALATIGSSAAAATLFYYNTDDYYKDDNHNAQGLYATQAGLMREKLESVGATTATLTDYSSGHAVPQKEGDLQEMYNFILAHTHAVSAIKAVRREPDGEGAGKGVYDLSGRRWADSRRGIIIKGGRLILNK